MVVRTRGYCWRGARVSFCYLHDRYTIILFTGKMLCNFTNRQLEIRCPILSVSASVRRLETQSRPFSRISRQNPSSNHGEDVEEAPGPIPMGGGCRGRRAPTRHRDGDRGRGAVQGVVLHRRPVGHPADLPPPPRPAVKGDAARDEGHEVTSYSGSEVCSACSSCGVFPHSVSDRRHDVSVSDGRPPAVVTNQRWDRCNEAEEEFIR